MIEIFGPTYRYNGEVLTSPEIIYILDHHYDEEAQCFHVKQLLENSTCDPKEHILLFNHVNHEDELKEYQCLCLPIFLAVEAEEFKQQNIQRDWSNKTHTFNFMINKPRRHRELLLLLVEHFKLSNYTHTLPWANTNISRRDLTAATQNTLYQDIIANTQINIPLTDYKFGPETKMEKGIKNGSFKNSETYQGLLQKNIFEPSCISLITEPTFFEKETMHTEKSIMAMYGGTLPIWIGGWRLADYLTSMGFDVFDDIIDHSYQNMLDPTDRCYYAFEKNLDLLRDFDRVKEFIANNQTRLEHNIKLLNDNIFLEDCFNKIEHYTGRVKEVLKIIVPEYRHNMFSPYRSLKDYRLLGNAPAGAL